VADSAPTDQVTGEAPAGAALGPDNGEREQMPRVRLTRARVIGSVLFVATTVAFLYFVLPKLLGLHETWNRLQQGDTWWLAMALVFEALSFAGYVALFRAVFVRDAPQIGWRESYQITMAGVVATRLFAAAGAGGIALTAWALTRAGLEARAVATKMIAFITLLYGVYMGTLVIDGLGLYLGLWPGPAPFAITMVPAIFGASVIILFLAFSLLPVDFERLVARWTKGSNGRLATLARNLATAPAAGASGVRTAIALVRTKDLSLLGAVAWWYFDIATLWACFHAFGASPPKGVIIMGYFVGMLANTLPLPGGIGGVDGGMIGAFTAFGIPVETAVVAVLAYRAFSFWLPMIPGALAYVGLRRTVSRWRTAQAPSYT
jgi:uncharacterized protein (TIRG00374 family)